MPGGRPRVASALPDEVVEDILARLPVKSLLRFRCVSRSWRDAIGSPAFHRLHSNKRAGCRDRTLFVRPSGHRQPFYAWQYSNGGAVEQIMGALFCLTDGNVFPLTKSCRGLVLLRSYEYDTHYIWNPATREIMTLPDRTPFQMAGRNPRPPLSYGLGYCSMTNQYKVVRLYHIAEPANSTVCEVLTLDKSAYWRPAATKPPLCRPTRSYNKHGAVFCNGNLHFIGDQEGGAITTFNVTHETFGSLVPPPELNRYELTELDGCLCAYPSRSFCRPGETYCIWFLTDERWKKLCCIDWGTMPEPERELLRTNWFAPLGIYHNESDKAKKVMFGTGSCKVFVMDPNNGVPEIMFSLEGMHRDDIFPTMGLFEESLAPVGRTSEDIIKSSPSMRVWWPVLSRLPARMVGRLNQVCREWRAMIKEESFINEHLQINNLNKSPQVMFTDGKPEMFKSMEKFINTSDVPPLIDVGSRVVCSKPCHGLIAGSFTSYDFVCNPVTDYYKAIPLDKDRRELRGSSLHEDIAWRAAHCTEDAMFAGRFGLGYDEEIGMHLLVRLAYMERNLATKTYKLECKVRYINDLFWERVEPPPKPVANMPPQYANGKIYWIVDAELEQMPSALEILVLDVITRKFEVLQGPPCIGDNNKCMSILELQQVLCVAISHHTTGIMEIWAMVYSGSWSVKYNIELKRFSPEYSTKLTTPLAVDARDGRILLSTGRSLGYYDPKTAELEIIYRLGGHVEGKNLQKTFA
ncbi:hypothetical protein EJB05_21901, partial [Eragrostis curvula]